MIDWEECGERGKRTERSRFGTERKGECDAPLAMVEFVFLFRFKSAVLRGLCRVCLILK